MCTDTTRVADGAQSARLTAMRSRRHSGRRRSVAPNQRSGRTEPKMLSIVADAGATALAARAGALRLVRASCARSLYRHAFNPVRPAGPDSTAAQILDWAQLASLPVGCLSEPTVLRTALEALAFPQDGSRAAANTIIRKRAVLHGGSATRPRPGWTASDGGYRSHQQPSTQLSWPAPNRSTRCWMRSPGPTRS